LRGNETLVNGHSVRVDTATALRHLFVEESSMITLTEVRERLAGDSQSLREFGVRSLSVFGSVARGDATERSDIDVLVEFDAPVGFFDMARLKYHLEDLLGAPVDLVTAGGLRDSMRERILREAVRAA
jgi:hypothetical protein